MRLIYLFVVVLLFQFSLIGQNTERLTETLQFPREQAEVRINGVLTFVDKLHLFSYFIEWSGGPLPMKIRFASEAERTWLSENALETSEIVDFRSMVVVDREDGAERGLTQVKAVDDAYPIYGTPVLSPEMSLSEAFEGQRGVPGAVMDKLLIDRLGLEIGDIFRLGSADLILMAELVSEPDSAAGGFGLGPRTLVRTDSLERSGLIGPGSLFETEYRMRLPEGTDLAALEAEAMTLFRDSGLRWQDSRNGAPGAQAFVERVGAFIVLVGLAGLAVGGVGVSAAVRAYLSAKTPVIATLKTLGAPSRTIFATYLIQIGLISALGVALGVALGAALPLIFQPIIEARLPVPANFGLHPGPLLEAALYGALTALIFALWPLAKTEDVRAATLFREAGGTIGRLPKLVYLLAIIGLAALLVAAAAVFSGVPELALWTAAGIMGALVILGFAAMGIRALARWMSSQSWMRGRTPLRLAMAAVGGPREEAAAVRSSCPWDWA